MSKLYRYTSQGEGVFSIGKRLLPEELAKEAKEARAWILKPTLPEGEYRFYLTEAGKKKYEETLMKVHKKYLANITCEEIDRSDIQSIVYEDEFQIVAEV